MYAPRTRVWTSTLISLTNPPPLCKGVDGQLMLTVALPTCPDAEEIGPKPAAMHARRACSAKSNEAHGLPLDRTGTSVFFSPWVTSVRQCATYPAYGSVTKSRRSASTPISVWRVPLGQSI